MKPKIGFLSALLSTRKAKKLTPQQIREIQKERLDVLIRHARAHSAVYREKYAGLPDHPTLESLPTSSKPELMARFDDWVTDPVVKLADLQQYVKDEENIGQPFLGKYLVATTSGSTGVPAVMMYDINNMNVLDALAVTRSMAYKGVMGRLVKAGGKSAAVYATGGHYLGVASVRYKQYKNPLKAKQFAVFSVLWPVEHIVEQLNAFRPALLGGYPTALELLIPEKQSGRLTIEPVLINTGGEYLSPELARRLSEAFGCPVQSGYACTEGGLIAFQCREGHLHVNDDWVIIEPVDAAGNPVPPGTLADKIYITNLASFAQPVIRYEVTDRVRVLTEPCACGSLLTAIEVEGCTDDMLEFPDGVRIPPLSVYVVLKETPGVVRFQVMQRNDAEVELRLETTPRNDDVAREAVSRLSAFFREKGANPAVVLSAETPSRNASGKFRHVMKA